MGAATQRAAQAERKTQSLWKHRNLVFGIPAIFIYLIAEIGVGNLFINFVSQPNIGNLTHQQASALSFLDFDYAFKLGGKSIVKGLVRTLADVPPGQQEKVTIPINIDLMAVGSTIVSAITNRSKVDVGLDANMNVNTPFGVVPLKIANLSSLKIE